MDAILDVQNLTMDFGGLRAIAGVTLQVGAGEVVALIGPNGAGKTTVFNCLTGIYTPTAGDIFISRPGHKRRRINGIKTHRITRFGIARTFQNIRLFPEMTVLENVMIGRHCRTAAGIIDAIVRSGGTRKEEQAIVETSYAILQKMGLADDVNELARNLPYGAQRRLEIARAVANDSPNL